MCILSGIGIYSMLTGYCKQIDPTPPIVTTGASGAAHSTIGAHSETSSTQKRKQQRFESNFFMKNEIATFFIGLSAVLLCMYSYHCIWVTSEACSAPSIVFSARSHDGSRIVFDDFREAYYWLRQNTPEDAKIMSWWDYGFQISAMAHRTIIVDNSTWNNTHISRVGQAMASSEDKAYEIMKELDVNYVLVIFGGLNGYSSDDIKSSTFFFS